MKRYNVHVIDNHKYVDETSAGRYVDADIAQELYDTLVNVLSEMEHNPILEAEIQDILTKANKD